MYQCQFNCGHDAFASAGARTSHENNYCPNRPEETVKGKYDRMAEEATGLENPGSLFGVPVSELIKDGVLLERMRTILRQRGDDPQVWEALYVQVDPVVAE